jgi:hypothetical protein
MLRLAKRDRLAAAATAFAFEGEKLACLTLTANMVAPAMNNNAAKGFDHKEITKRILWTIGRIKCLVTQRIAGEQFALHRGAVSSPAAAQRTASVSQNADPDLRP